MDHECPPIESVIADIEKYDLSVMLINEDEDFLLFAYSVGQYHTFKHPEILVFGLESEVAHWIINELARRIKDGERFCRLAGAPGARKSAQSGAVRLEFLKNSLERG